MVEMATGFIILTDYLVQSWDHGKRKGIDQYFGSMSEIKEYFADSRGNLPTWRFIRSNERVPDSEKHGLIIEERRWKCPKALKCCSSSAFVLASSAVRSATRLSSSAFSFSSSRVLRQTQNPRYDFCSRKLFRLEGGSSALFVSRSGRRRCAMPCDDSFDRIPRLFGAFWPRLHRPHHQVGASEGENAALVIMTFLA